VKGRGRAAERPAASARTRRADGPAIDADVSGRELDPEVRRELSGLPVETAQDVARHLVMTARLLDGDPRTAHAHALAARARAPRIGVIREAVGLAAYAAGEWAQALAELRAARRISGLTQHWPVMADCERALGRPERALQMAAAPEVARLDRAAVVEMRIVAAGARADLGQSEAAVVTLQTDDLNDTTAGPWCARLRCAYAAALEAVGRDAEARLWYARAVAVDPDGVSGAAERLLELDGIEFYEAEPDPDQPPGRPD